MPILIVEHAGQRKAVPLEGRVWIGRDETCQVVINHPIVSRQHAFVEPNGTEAIAVVTDNHSRNGILIAGQKLEAPRPLRDGDTFQVGPATIAFHASEPQIDIEAPSVDADEVAGIVFACECGARLWAPRGFGGSSTTCPQCRRKVRCPGGAGGIDVAALNICPVCQWKIEPTEPSTRCPSCGLNHHADCWTENKGCSAYGCPQVNALLRDDPERTDGDMIESVDAAGIEEPTESPTSQASVEIPLLACAVLASLVGLVAYGIPAAIVACVAFGYMLVRQGRSRLWLATVAVLAMVGAAAGTLASLYLWMGLSPSALIGR